MNSTQSVHVAGVALFEGRSLSGITPAAPLREVRS